MVPASSFTVTSLMLSVANSTGSFSSSPTKRGFSLNTCSSVLVSKPEVTCPSSPIRSTNTPPSEALPITNASPAAVASSASKFPSKMACWSAAMSTAPSVPESTVLAWPETSSSKRICVSRPKVNSVPLTIPTTTPPLSEVCIISPAKTGLPGSRIRTSPVTGLIARTIPSSFATSPTIVDIFTLQIFALRRKK